MFGSGGPTAVARPRPRSRWSYISHGFRSSGGGRAFRGFGAGSGHVVGRWLGFGVWASSLGQGILVAPGKGRRSASASMLASAACISAGGSGARVGGLDVRWTVFGVMV